MKVALEKLPSIQDLEQAYSAILSSQRGDGNMNPFYFSKVCQWIRFDSRLGEICVDFLTHHWKRLNPIQLNEAFCSQPWPGILGVLLEFCGIDSKIFQHWKATATCNFPKANWELFYIGKRRLAGRLMMDDARFSLEEYKKWGFLSREILINKSSKSIEPTKINYSKETRNQILKEMLSHAPRITTQDYWEAIGKCISKRQAERDLESSSLVQGRGKTRGRFFVMT